MRSNRKPIAAKAAAIYKDWHWGNSPTQLIQWDDPQVPDPLIEIGRLVEIRLVDRAGTPTRLVTHQADLDNTHLTFDPASPLQRLYLLLPQEYRRAVRRLYDPDQKAIRLPWLAKNACSESTHLDGYPAEVGGQPLGFVTHLIYLTHKKGDGVSQYIHELGEDDKQAGKKPRLPLLVADPTGRLWIVGGAYTCPNEGITN